MDDSEKIDIAVAAKHFAEEKGADQGRSSQHRTGEVDGSKESGGYPNGGRAFVELFKAVEEKRLQYEFLNECPDDISEYRLHIREPSWVGRNLAAERTDENDQEEGGRQTAAQYGGGARQLRESETEARERPTVHQRVQEHDDQHRDSGDHGPAVAD